jgi:major vault protein
MAELGRNRDYPIPQGFYVHVRERTKGTVSAFVGPNKLAMSDSEDVVAWNPTEKRYDVLANPELGIKPFAMIMENQYAVLSNPAGSKDGKPETPRAGASSNPVDLRMGERVIIHGPQSFALWPMQSAKVTNGHTMKSNEYILVGVMDPELAAANWDKLIVKRSAETTSADDKDSFFNIDPKTLVKGQRVIIKGTEISFFMPVTGLRVVAKEAFADGRRNYIQEAVTLEMLEYCILLDENGSKRFVRGPAVVFPRPTEAFVSEKHSQVFRAIELSSTSGVHVKVTADYIDDQSILPPGVRATSAVMSVGSGTIKAGTELFISGNEQAIYFPRAEHALIEYESVGADGSSTREKVHYASAVPKGHGRYVLNRDTGEVTLKVGPAMLLLNPAKEVIVQRVLSDGETKLWFPNNTEALMYNQTLTNASLSSASAYLATSGPSAVGSTESMGARGTTKGLLSDGKIGAGSDSFARRATFTAPKTVKIDDRFTGAVSIGIWPGYAVQVVDKSGDRRVEVGPKTVLLQYSEDLTRLQMSTGKPKNTDKLFDTVYLKVRGNQISDVVKVTTADHVDVEIKIAYQVNFVGDSQKWFDIENYVKLICDFNRSVLKGKIRQINIHDFISNGVEIVRDAVLGTKPESGKRAGRLFEENNAQIYECEVLDLKLTDETTARLIAASQQLIVKSSLDVSVKEATLELVKRGETADRAALVETQLTAQARNEAALANAAREQAVEEADVIAKAEVQSIDKKAELALQSTLQAISDAILARQKNAADAKIYLSTQEAELQAKTIAATTEAIKERISAISPDLAKALNANSDNEALAEISKHLGIAAYLNKGSVGAVLDGLLQGTSLEAVVKNMGAVKSIGSK